MKKLGLILILLFGVATSACSGNNDTFPLPAPQLRLSATKKTTSPSIFEKCLSLKTYKRFDIGKGMVLVLSLK